MENAVDALKLAAATIIFVMALAISISVFNQAKATSDALLYAQDESNYYDYYTYDYENYGQNSSQYEDRIVGLETVIPTLYNYYKENYTVIFKKGRLNEDGSLSEVENMVLYTSKSPYQGPTGAVLWGDYDWTKYWGTGSDSKKYQICSFDMDEETKRREPWAGKPDEARYNLYCFINGINYTVPSEDENLTMYYSQGDNLNSIIRKALGYQESNPQFVEQIGEYVYDQGEEGTDTTVTIDGEVTSILRKNKKRVITYTLITNQ